MRLFKLYREEFPIAAVAFTILLLLNAMVIYRYYYIFSPDVNGGYWNLFFGKFHISGFDALNYITLSKWGDYYAQYRHPLLVWMMYPLYILNMCLISLTGINMAQFVYAILLIFCGFYSFIFTYRILRNVIEINKIDSIILSAFLFSFAYIMIALSVPDHFTISLFILLLTLYVAGLKMKENKTFKSWQIALLFLLSSGTTITNGAKVYIDAIFTNGKSFFKTKKFFLSAIIPILIIISVCILEYGMPSVNAFGNQNNSSIKIKKQISRKDAVIENLFGESIQLHQSHLLEDQMISRPYLVTYSHYYNYLVEATIVILFAFGIWRGRKEKLLWICVFGFMFDILIHIVMKFGIDEVYIMGPHWLFVIPISIAYIFKTSSKNKLIFYRTLLSVLTIYLWAYNGTLFTKYLFF